MVALHSLSKTAILREKKKKNLAGWIDLSSLQQPERNFLGHSISQEDQVVLTGKRIFSGQETRCKLNAT